MEVQNGFIVGIFNYCDRWCETCAYTSRCRLFADQARIEASLDPTMRAVTEARLPPEDQLPPPPKWFQEMVEKVEEEVTRMTPAELVQFEPKIRQEHKEIYERAFAYCLWVFDWLRDRGREEALDPSHPLSVIAWFASLNSSKIYRALTGLAEFDGDRECPPDHEGSAKVALIGIERSLVAWRELVQCGEVPAQSAAHCVRELEWLEREVERVVPEARAFVRPGFDEQDELARLLASDSVE